MSLKAVSTAVLMSAALIAPISASASTMASALTDLNIRSGPGSEFDVVGVIKNDDRALVRGCIEGSLWCEVSYNGRQGWAYSKYLRAPGGGQPVVLADRQADLPIVRYDRAPAAGGVAAGAATGAIAGALIAGPVGAAVGGSIGAATGAAFVPPPPVGAYITNNPVDPVYLDGEVVVGASLPNTVQVYPVPESQYEYAYVNRLPVLVQPGSRRIVYVYR